MSTEVALISIWQDGYRWWREDQVESMLAAHDEAIRADEREKAGERVEAEYLVDGLDNDSDNAYNTAIRHAAAAARGDGNHE